MIAALPTEPGKGYPRCAKDCGACHRQIVEQTGMIGGFRSQRSRPDPDPDAFDCQRCQHCGESKRDSIYNAAFDSRPSGDPEADAADDAEYEGYFCCEQAYNLAHYGTPDPPGLPDAGATR